MRANMPHASHGLFVDLVSFSKFFGAERYVEKNTMLNEVYMSSKIGYATIADSIVASSFQNVLPGAYCCPISSSKSNKKKFQHRQNYQECLPSQNGITGMVTRVEYPHHTCIWL